MDPENDSIIGNDQSNEDTKRRAFIAKTTFGVSAACAVLPLASGIPSILDPIHDSTDNQPSEEPWSKVALLTNVPEDGTPAKFSVTLEKVTDAWTTLRDVPVGAVYLVRKGNLIKAFNLKCPHLGCAIDYRGNKGDFFCPCHNSAFDLDGSISNPDSPSPRGMDELETKTEEGFVWIRFKQFRPNLKERIPVA